MPSILISALDFAIPVLIVIFIGLFGTAVLIELGLMQRLSRFASPIFRFTNLPDTCASSFVVSMGSTVAANTMVVNFRDSGCINNREAVLCAVMNSTPAYVREIFTYQIPIVLPALGPVVGGFYVMVFIVTAIVKVVTVVVLSKLLLKKNPCKFEETVTEKKVTLREAVVRSLRKNKKLFIKISMVYLAMTTLVFYLRDRGAFEVFSVLPLADIFGIPPESIVPLTSFVASPILGISLLGPMLSDNGISPLQAMIVLMLGSMFMLPIFSIRTLLPRYISIFGARTGTGIVTFSTGISVLVRFVILLVLLSMAD
ncbi:nucleoside recognition domain-containing protein [Methanolobus chelungpuianus]|uniref:Nucleoside recognition protein n=1 Tax=Methanolobus chelungpuianus TaxID=502115 RepID=A0AAE3HBW2_9EURY|nr:nucleoside recognition domain-containing protein [Methanolobus chelungpuianus]MCQ6962923.1 nucleoside recognition protein [Methanolobus chelungpuianus]